MTLAGFELKQVPGQYSPLMQCLAWNLVLPECLHDLPQCPSLCSELFQEWPIETGKNFATVCSAVARTATEVKKC